MKRKKGPEDGKMEGRGTRKSPSGPLERIKELRKDREGIEMDAMGGSSPSRSKKKKKKKKKTKKKQI